MRSSRRWKRRRLPSLRNSHDTPKPSSTSSTENDETTAAQKITDGDQSARQRRQFLADIVEHLHHLRHDIGHQIHQPPGWPRSSARRDRTRPAVSSGAAADDSRCNRRAARAPGPGARTVRRPRPSCGTTRERHAGKSDRPSASVWPSITRERTASSMLFRRALVGLLRDSAQAFLQRQCGAHQRCELAGDQCEISRADAALQQGSACRACASRAARLPVHSSGARPWSRNCWRTWRGASPSRTPFFSRPFGSSAVYSKAPIRQRVPGYSGIMDKRQTADGTAARNAQSPCVTRRTSSTEVIALQHLRPSHPADAGRVACALRVPVPVRWRRHESWRAWRHRVSPVRRCRYARDSPADYSSGNRAGGRASADCPRERPSASQSAWPAA